MKYPLMRIIKKTNLIGKAINLKINNFSNKIKIINYYK